MWVPLSVVTHGDCVMHSRPFANGGRTDVVVQVDGDDSRLVADRLQPILNRRLSGAFEDVGYAFYRQRVVWAHSIWGRTSSHPAWLAYTQQPHVRRESRHTKYAQRKRRMRPVVVAAATGAVDSVVGQIILKTGSR